MNGRVIFDNVPGTSYNLYESNTNVNNSTNMNYNNFNPNANQNMLRGVQTSNTLSSAFFSKRNVDFIQNKIIQKISECTGYRINRQSDTELQIIMRSIYLQYSKNLECNIKDQLSELNYKVLMFCIDRIKTEISQFIKYKDDVSKMPTPLVHPQNLSNKGEKSLTFFKPL